MTTELLTWTWDGAAVRVGCDREGAGRSVLLLPALSSISTRGEMRPLQDRLAPGFAATAIDWPGFGDRPRPPVAWTPDAYKAFLKHVLEDVVPRPFATVAAGHAASYALWAAASMPGSAGRLCLIAPTWRGPLPTMMNGKRGPADWIARAGDLPVLGSLLYRLNVNRPVVRMMAKGHVYNDPDWLQGERLKQKLAVVSAPGARHASIRFVTGKLDVMADRAAFVAAAERAAVPILVVYGAETPRKSKAEMEALRPLANVRLVELPRGKLAVHEEFPDAVAEQVTAFLSERA